MIHPSFARLLAPRVCAPIAVAAALAVLSGCVPSRPAAGFLKPSFDGSQWASRDPERRQGAPATRALIAEMDAVEGAINAEIAWLKARGATEGQLLIAGKPLACFQAMRRQIEAVLIDSARTAPHHRQFREAIYSPSPVDPRFNIAAFSDAVAFTEAAFPIYDVRQALDLEDVTSVFPFNLGQVFIGVAGTDYNAVRGAYSPPRPALFEDATVPRIYRLPVRQTYAKDFTDFLARMRPGAMSMAFPSVAGDIIPLDEEQRPLPVRALRLAVFSASRADAADPDASTDALVFYWALINDDTDVVIPDAMRNTPLLLGLDYIVSPATVGRPARAYKPAEPVCCLGRQAVSPWRVALCGPFEVVAKLFSGAKQTVCEAAKAPVVAVAAAPRHGLGFSARAVGQCFERIGATWEVLFRTWPVRWPQDSLVAILAETPLIGKRFPAALREPRAAALEARRHIYLTRGAYGGGEEDQFTQNWQHTLSTAYARVTALSPAPADVAAVPYRHGTGLDALWSALNLSDGPGYEMARDILFADPDDGPPVARPGETIYLTGHAEGACRAEAAARVLEAAGVPVEAVLNFRAAPMPRIEQPRVLAPARGEATTWPVSRREAARTPGAFDPVTGLFNWRATGQEAQLRFLP